MLVYLLYLNIIRPTFIFFKSEACSSVYGYVSIVNNFKEKLLLPRCECMGVISSERGSDL